MTIEVYIINDQDEKVAFTPEPAELKDIKFQMRLGMKEGIISLITPMRRTTTFWKVL